MSGGSITGKARKYFRLHNVQFLGILFKGRGRESSCSVKLAMYYGREW